MAESRAECIRDRRNLAYTHTNSPDDRLKSGKSNICLLLAFCFFPTWYFRGGPHDGSQSGSNFCPTTPRHGQKRTMQRQDDMISNSAASPRKQKEKNGRHPGNRMVGPHLDRREKTNLDKKTRINFFHPHSPPLLTTPQ